MLIGKVTESWSQKLRKVGRDSCKKSVAVVTESVRIVAERLSG